MHSLKKERYLQMLKLSVENLPAITCCQACGDTYATVEYGKTCPYCNSEDTYLVQENEFNIKEIRVR